MNSDFDERIEDSPLGPVRIAARGEDLIGLWFCGQRYEAAGGRVLPDQPVLQTAAQWLRAYFDGVAAPKPRLRPIGSAFQQSVWAQLLQIPAGQTVSYGEVAAAIGQPQAVRAVAAAIGRNPISILIPCHRVLGANRHLTGYAGGLGRKSALLALESGQTLPWRIVGRGYTSQYEDPIAVAAGAVVQFIDRPDDGEYAGWKWAQAQDGRAGWVPRVFFSEGPPARALRSYSARELTVAAGAEVLALDQFSGWIWARDRSGRSGWIPEAVLA